MSTYYTINEEEEEEEAKNSLQNEFYIIKLWFYETQMVFNASKWPGIWFEKDTEHKIFVL